MADSTRTTGSASETSRLCRPSSLTMLRGSDCFLLILAAGAPDMPARPQASCLSDPAPPPPENQLAVTPSARQCKLAPVPIRERH
jgi:hypothetical protein